MKFFKKIKIPSGEQMDILAYESWSVKWVALSGEVRYPSLSTKDFKAEVFTSKEDAEQFANSIRGAFQLIGMSGGVTDVKVEKNNNHV